MVIQIFKKIFSVLFPDDNRTVLDFDYKERRPYKRDFGKTKRVESGKLAPSILKRSRSESAISQRIPDQVTWNPPAEHHPPHPFAGDIYHNTKDRNTYIFNGVEWLIIADTTSTEDPISPSPIWNVLNRRTTETGPR